MMPMATTNKAHFSEVDMCGMTRGYAPQKNRFNGGVDKPLMDKMKNGGQPFIDRINSGRVTGKPVNNIPPPSEGNPKLPRFGQP